MVKVYHAGILGHVVKLNIFIKQINQSNPSIRVIILKTLLESFSHRLGDRAIFLI
jgi:hypothetical protein